jgi:hypothetical protein
MRLVDQQVEQKIGRSCSAAPRPERLHAGRRAVSVLSPNGPKATDDHRTAPPAPPSDQQAKGGGGITTSVSSSLIPPGTIRVIVWIDPGMADTRLTSSPESRARAGPGTGVRSLSARLVRRITTAEWIVGGLVAALMLVLILLEPDILEAPVENSRTILFILGGTIASAVALGVMLWFKVPAILRIVVLWVPFAIATWWLISPFFIDDAVDEDFATSIAAQLDNGEGSATRGTTSESPDATPRGPVAPEGTPEEAPAGEPIAEPASPVLLGSGRFVGLAGHSGTGDAGIFRNPGGSYALRFENFDVENGPDLEVYLVPGADRTSLEPGSIHLGALKGNVGNQTYDLPPGTDLVPGPYTALIWCQAFTVEFVGATLTIT